MKSVLIVASFPQSIISFRGEFIQRLVERGCTVNVAAPGLLDFPIVCEELRSRGVFSHDIPLARTGTNLLSDLRFVYRLVRLIIKVRPDTVFSYTIKPVIYGTLAAWVARVPNRYALVTGLGYAFTAGRGGLLIKMIRLLYSASLGKASTVFFQNPDDEALFRREGLLRASVRSLVVNGSGVDTKKFAMRSPPSGSVMFLMVARLLINKGVREYAAAARIVKGLYPASQFNLVGWIDENPDSISRSELDDWINEGYINFLGRLDDVRSAISSAMVYVLPSYREGTPRTVLEAMSIGRAIITTDAPGCRETVIDGENGLLVPVKSVSALAEAMVRCIREPDLVALMGKRSREIAESRYDVHKVNAMMLGVMDTMDCHVRGERP